jgi:hypothetical protein
MTTITRPTQTKARKKHRCGYCTYHINPNDIYLRSTHTYDGEIYTWKSHVHCNDIADKLNMFDRCDEGLTCDDFIEEIKNEYHNLDPEGDKLPAKAEFKEYLDFVLSNHLPETD